jgi:hypothetical protein
MAEHSPRQDRPPGSRRKATTVVAWILVVVGFLGVVAAGITIAMEVSGFVDTGWNLIQLVTKVVSPLLWVLIGVAMWRRRSIAKRFVVVAMVWWVLYALSRMLALGWPLDEAGVSLMVTYAFGLIPYAMLLWYLSREGVRQEFGV